MGVLSCQGLVLLCFLLFIHSLFCEVLCGWQQNGGKGFGLWPAVVQEELGVVALICGWQQTAFFSFLVAA